MKIKDCFEVLEIPAGTNLTKSVIKNAFRIKALATHSDKNDADDAKEKMQQVLEARNILNSLTSLDAKSIQTQIDKEEAQEQLSAEHSRGWCAPMRSQAYAPVPNKDYDFPKSIHIIQGGSGATDFINSLMFIKTLKNQTVTLDIAISKEDDAMLNPRTIIEGLLTAYLSHHPEINLSRCIDQLSEEADLEIKREPEVNSVLIAADGNHMQALSRLSELASLNDLQIHQLSELIGLTWVSCGKLIKATMPSLPIFDFQKLTHGGHIITRTTKLDPELMNVDSTQPANTHPQLQQHHSQTLLIDYLNTCHNWNGKVPTGIAQMRTAIEGTSQEPAAIFESLQTIASDRQEAHEQQTGFIGFFQSRARNPQASVLYQRLVEAKSMSDVTAWLQSLRPEEETALVVTESNAGGGGSKEPSSSSNTTNGL